MIGGLNNKNVAKTNIGHIVALPVRERANMLSKVNLIRIESAHRIACLVVFARLATFAMENNVFVKANASERLSRPQKRFTKFILN
ncbi:hypothetical protein B4U80_08498 [Leptotrombidium deliense]|uniref:Uncharacterized protein n=1 Tax=Leptotrombidium deliense TaxID=299467 RepID=A0A443SGM2_9ACAR|nr:hypothetical protein B4U80_08498 [Leptotrombidium deliense]